VHVRARTHKEVSELSGHVFIAGGDCHRHMLKPGWKWLYDADFLKVVTGCDSGSMEMTPNQLFAYSKLFSPDN